MPKEPLPPKLLPTRPKPKRSEHFVPFEEGVPSREPNPEERMIAKEEGTLEEPAGSPEPRFDEPSEQEPLPVRNLPEGVTRGISGAHVPSAPVSGQKSANIRRAQRPDDTWAPGRPYHRKGSKLAEEQGHGLHGRKPERPKGGETMRKIPDKEAA